MIVICGFTVGQPGSTLASDTNRPGTPWTSPHGPTTLVAASAPMRAVPTGWNAVRRSEPGFTASSFRSSSCDLLVTGPRPGRPLNTARAPAARKISAVCANPRTIRRVSCLFSLYVISGSLPARRITRPLDVSLTNRPALASFGYAPSCSLRRSPIPGNVPAPTPDQVRLLARVGVLGRAGVLRARQVREVHGELSVERAPERTHTAAAAAFDVPADRLAVQAELLHAAAEDARVLAEQLFGNRLHVLDALDAVEEGLHRFRIDAREAEVLLPAPQHAVGRAEARAGVDQRRATEAQAERHGDRRCPQRGRHPLASVEALEPLERRAGHVLSRVVRPFLEHDDGVAELRELF